MLEGRSMFQNVSEYVEMEAAIAAGELIGHEESGGDSGSQLRTMDRDGVDVAILFPTLGLYLDTPDAGLTEALCGAYNAWIRDLASQDRHRLRPAAVVPRVDPDRMVGSLEEIVRHGHRIVVLRPNPVQGRCLGHPAYDPFWAACEHHGVTIALHEGTHSALPTAGADRFTSRFALHACSHPFEQMMALLSLIEGGALERHPRLRVALLESGCGWLPYWLWRLDEVEYKHHRAEIADCVRMPPSEYFRRQCFVTVEPGEPNLPDVIAYLGDDRLLFGTDFPHMDHDADLVEQALELHTRIPEPSLRKLLGSNAAVLFGV
jgi:predicted TIM-barrel fold metal-dependent hydrolase